MKPTLIHGGIFNDDRGVIRHTNNFTLTNICRFYTIEHIDTNVVRAWQGHQKETKYFTPIKGSFIVAWVKIDDFENPSDSLYADYTILSENEINVLHIPPGYANGLRALKSNSIIGVFSDMLNEQSVKEKIRYPAHKWFDWYQDFSKDIK